MKHHKSTGPLVHRLTFRQLLVVPILLSITAAILLGAHSSDLNIPALYSQCHAHSRLPALSRVTVLGVPSCFLISLFQLANDAVRSLAHMGVILSFVGALLTASLVESARVCNRPSRVVGNPALVWLVFNLAGGAFVWGLVVVPAFLRRSRELERERKAALESGTDVAAVDSGTRSRELSGKAEVYAVPLSVALGFFVPSVLMLTLNEPVSIAVWLLFPLLVSAVRNAVKLVVERLLTDDEPFRLESYRSSVVIVYLVPFVCSVLSHGFFIWNLFSAEDRREMTRSAIKFIEIDISIIGATVIYWLLVESGWFPTLLMVGLSALLGPGAALCCAWLLRERAICQWIEVQAGDDAVVVESGNNEETPLLR